MLPYSEACERNKDPILGVLRSAFAQRRAVLEIGSGTGQHAAYFAGALPHLTWQPSERLPGLEDLRTYVAHQGLVNLHSPMLLDVRHEHWPVQHVDAAFTANTLHIMSWEEVTALFEGLRAALTPDAVFCIYGPFSYAGRHTSESNQRFDAMLRERDPPSGIRDLDAVLNLGGHNGLTLTHDHEMPANNRLIELSFAG